VARLGSARFGSAGRRGRFINVPGAGQGGPLRLHGLLLGRTDRRRAGHVGADAQRAETVDDVGVDLQGRLRGLDFIDQGRVVEPQGLNGLLVVDMQAAPDDLLVDVVQPVLAKGPGPETFLGVLDVGDAQVEDLDHVEHLAEHLGLLVVAGQAVEDRTLAVLKAVREVVSIPVAVKLSPFFTSVAHLAGRLAAEGAAGLVLFNRFYQPDLDLEELEVARTLQLSTSAELPLRLRWLGVLAGRVDCSLACSGGVHSAEDALKAVMSGADAVQLVSALLRHGPARLAEVRRDLEAWLEEHEYESLAQAKGSLGLLRCPDPRAYERANYVQILQTWER